MPCDSGVQRKSSEQLLTRPALKFAFLEEHSQQYSIARLCQALDVSQSGYYAWKERETSTHCREDAQLSAEIQQIFVEHREGYGSPRILAVLQERGWQTSRKRVARLMRTLGLSAQRKRSGKATTQSDPRARFAATILNRQFESDQPNEKWVSDTKAVETSEGWL